ncbi:MAG: dipeptidase [Nannocystaceae bacterium]|nr:dipeptidase [Nannocystaceae bacterium]
MRWIGPLASLLLLACDARAPAPVPVPPPVERAPEPVAALEPTTPAEPSTPPEPAPPTDPAALAPWLTEHAIIVDGHVDLPWRLSKSAAKDGSLTEDVTQRTAAGDFDWPRARQGGLDAPFMSIYVASSFEGKGAKAEAERLIALVEGLAAAAPEKFALARSPADIRSNAKMGLVSLPLGMENGAPLEGELGNVAYFHGRGIRYITLTHAKDNHISDSSFDTHHTHKGLSAFGKQVVAEMNRVGIMVDVSHVSDQAFWQVLEQSKVPVIASHSSCRHFTPGWERNMSDEMIRALAERGGVVMINFGSGFLDAAVRKQRDQHEAALTKHLRKAKLRADDEAAAEVTAAWLAEHPAPRATVEQVADHVEHVIALVGVDHVGLGSDFDGVGDSLPAGLRDVSEYPNLVRVLLERGHDRVAIEKLLGGNVLRVWEAVERHAARP